MAKVGTAEFEVELRRAKLKAEVDKIGQDIEKGLGDAAKKASDEIDRELSRKRELAGAGVAAGTLLLFGQATKAASSLGEAQAKAQAVFGESYAEVKRFAEGAAQSLGQSERQALDAAGSYGNLLRAMKLNTEQAKEMSLGFVQLATDLASFNDRSVDDALIALRSGLSGETEPLKAFGVNLNEARIKQEALTRGLWDGVGAIDSAAKAQAIYAIVMEDTTIAQGSFAREADSYAGSLKRTQAEAENTSASIGDSLLPILTKVNEVAGFTASAFGALPGPMQTAVVAGGGLALTFGLLGPKIGESVAMLGRAGSKIIEFSSGVGGATSKFGGFVGAVASSPAALGATAGAVGLLTAVLEVNSQMAKTAKANIDLLLAGSGDPVEQLRETLAATVAGVEGGFQLDTSSGAFRDWVKETGTSATELFDILTGTQEEFDKFLAGMDGDGASPFVIRDVEKLRAAFDGASAKAGEYARAQEDLGIATEGTADANTDLTAKAKTAADALTEQSRAARDLFDAHRGVAASVESLTDAQDAVAEAHKGVADAERAVADAQRDVTDARKAVAEAHKGVQDALRGVADAERSAADARVDQAAAVAELAQAQRNAVYGTEELERANRDVTDAERALTDAQRESKLAQEDLTFARDRAKESLDDMARSAEGAALAEESARLGLREAQERLANLGSDGRDVSSTERERAQLAVELADLALRDAIDRNEDTAAKLAEMQAKGIEGSDEVVDAQGRITEATDAEAEAKDRLTEAQDRVVEVQAELAQAVEDAALRVEEANRRVEEADWRVIEAKYAVRDASDRVVEAQDRVREAQQRVVDQRDAVVEARKAVKDAEDDVALAALGVIEAQKEVDEKTRGASEAIRAQIGRLGELADTLDPNNPLRQHLRDYTGELLAAHVQAQLLNAMEIALGGEGSLPRRAAGGRVNAGQPYLVNDASGITRPEVFVPDAPGRVYASENEWRSQQGRSRSGNTIENLTIDASGLTLAEAIQFVPRAIAHDLLVASP